MKFLKFVVAILALALVPLASEPLPSAAQTAPNLQSALNAYLQGITGVPENATITGYSSVAVPCPAGYRCIWTPIVVLAALAQGDGGGQAIFVNNPNCPSCFTVLVASGGVFSLAEIENYGIDATTAQALVSGL